MDYGFTTAAYVVAAVLFILSLGGLSGQESAKRAVWYGIGGMGLAVLATLLGPGAGNWAVSVVMIGLGGAIEVAQHLTGWRHGEWADWAADALGVVVVAVCVGCWQIGLAGWRWWWS